MKKQLSKKELNKASGGNNDLYIILPILFTLLDGLVDIAQLKMDILNVKRLRKEGQNKKADEIAETIYKKVDSLNNADLSKYIRIVLNK